MKRSNKVRYKKYSLQNIQEQSAQPQKNTFDVFSDVTRDIYNARMDRFITNGSTEHSLIIQQRKFDAVAASPASDNLLKGIIGLTLPKTNTPSNLMHSTVNRAVKYTYQKTPYRNNLYEFNQSLDALKKAVHAGNATAYIFDLETITGKNAKNKEHYTAITELSIKSATLGADGKFLETAGDSIEGIIGFNAEQENSVRAMFGDYLSGKRKLDPKRMSEEQRVAFTEILNFDYAFQNGGVSSSAEITGEGFRLYKTKSKLSREELDARVKSMSQGDLIRSLDRGISRLREVHDSSDADAALKEYAKRLQFVDGKNIFAVGANIRQYDINVSRALGILNGDLTRNGVVDITELAQHHNALTRSSTRAGAQQSNVFKQLGLALPDDMVPHIASTDTYMSLGILNKALEPGNWIDQNLAAGNNRSTSEFKIGGIYRAGDTVDAPISFGRGKDGTIISSTGYTYDPLNKNHQLRRNYGYSFGFQKDMSYELVGHEVLDISQFSDEQKASFREMAGDKYLNSNNLHVVTMAPILDESDPRYTTESFTRSVILNEQDFQSAIGSFEHIGNVKTSKDGKTANVFFTGYKPSQMKNGPTIKTHNLESTVRSFEDNPFRMLSSMYSYTSTDVAHKELVDQLSAAIATGDQKQIDYIRSELAKSMHAFYAKKNNGIELTGKMAMHAESFANMSELVPVFQDYMRTEYGISDVSEYTETFNNALKSFTENLSIQSDSSTGQGFINVGHMVKSKPVTGDVLTFNINGISRDTAQHSSMTLNFNDYRGENRYKLAEKLWTASGYKSSDFKETDEYKRVQLLKRFTESLVNEDSYSGVKTVGSDIKKNQAVLDKLVDAGILSFNSEASTYGVSDIFDGDISASQLIDRMSGSLSDESIRYLKETQDKSSVLSTMIYDALKDSGVRTTSAESRMLPELKTGMFWGQGVSATRIESMDKFKELFRQTLEATPLTHTVSASHALSKDQKKSTINTMMAALVDEEIDPIHGSKFANFLSTKGFTQEEISRKAITVGNTISEYQDYLNYLVSAYSEAGLDFSITDNGIYARDSSSKYVKLNLPEIRRYDNGAVYIKYGGQDVAIESSAIIRDGKIQIRSPFSNRTGKAINNSKRIIAESERLGNKVSIETLTHQIQEDFRYNIAQAGEAFHETASNRFTSGGTLNVVDIVGNMFDGQGSLESIGALDAFASANPTDFRKMKDLFTDFKSKNANKPIDSISSIGQEFYELFTANAPTIFSSIAESGAVADDNIRSIFANLAPFATQEKTMFGGSYFIGTPRYSTALSGFFNQKRNTGFQNAKSPMSMSAARLTSIDGVRTGRTIETEDMIKAFSGDTGMVDSVRIKMAHMNQHEVYERLEKYIDSGAIEAAKGTYSEDTTKAALGILLASNVENDGAFISGELARALPQANVNTKSIDLTRVNFNGIRSKNKEDVIKGRDMIPQFSIDPGSGAVSVEYSKGFFVKQGEALVMLEKDKTLAAQMTTTYTTTQKNYIASIRYFNENGTELSERQVNQALATLKLDPALYGMNNQEIDNAVSKILKSKGITSTLKLNPIDIATKIGYGEEKTFATPLLLAFGGTQAQKDILAKYSGKDKRGILSSATGHILSQDAFDVIANYVGMSDEDIKTIQREMIAPTMFWKNALKGTSAADALLFTNINEVKHQSISDAASIMTQDIIDAYGDSPDKINSILGKVYGSSAKYDPKRQSALIGEQLDYINMDELIKAYRELPHKPGDIATSTVSIISADDWMAGKTTGNIAKDLAQVKQAYLNGDISSDEASRIQNQIRQKYTQDYRMEGTKLSQQEKNIFGSYKYNDNTLSSFVGAESDDAFISNTQRALEQRGILSKTDGLYSIADQYNKNTEPIYSGTYAAIDKIIKNGYDYEISTNPLGIADRKYQAKEIIDDYRHNIEPINNTDNFVLKENLIKKSEMNTISASQMAIPTGDIATEMLKDPNNPFTHDTVIDLGERFGSDRYLAVKGLDPKFYDDILIKTPYQKEFSSLRRESEMLSALDEDKLDRRIIDSRFNGRNLTKSEIQQELQQSILLHKQNILEQQANLLGGKNSVAASIMSERADMSAMLESQTATIPIGSKMESLYDNLSFEGTSLKEHVNKGHYIDFAVVNPDDVKQMGILDHADEYTDYLKKERSDFYNTLIGQVGQDASNEDIMMQAMRTEGINMYAGRYPTVHEHSVMGVRMYASDDVQRSTIRLPQWTQKKMKNDNDSDKVSVFNISEYFMQSQQADTTNIAIQSAENKTIGDKIIQDYMEGRSSDNFDPTIAARERTVFGHAYRNITDSSEYNDIQNQINQSQYRDDFMDLYSKAQSAANPKEGSYADDIFKDLVQQRQSTQGYDEGFAYEMKNLYIGKHRMDESLVAEIAQSSKGKVGFINNAVSIYTRIGDQFTTGMIGQVGDDAEQKLRYEAANELFSKQRGDLIENIINAKNTAGADQLTIVSDMISNMGIIEREYDKDKVGIAKEKLAGIIDTAIGSKYEDYIANSANTGTSIAKYLISQGFDLSDKNQMSEMRAALANLGVDVMSETSRRANIDFIHRAKVGTSSSGGYFLDDIDLRTTSDNGLAYNIDYDMTLHDNTAKRASQQFVEDNGDTIMRTAKIDTESIAKEASENVAKSTSSMAFGSTAKVLSQAMKNNVSKNLALGALGVAASVLAVGIIGGNPSHAPQDDAQAVPQDAYKYDNFDYGTGTVMQAPPMQNQGYVVNMRASTNGSYSEAQRSMIQSAQQSYSSPGGNMNVSVRHNFSYSANQDNDKYIEGILNRLM